MEVTMKRYLLAGIAVVLLLLIAGAAIALAAGTAVVTFSGPATVEIGKTYTYNYTMTVTGAAAANANIVVGGAFETVSGGAGLFYDTIPNNSSGSVSGSVTVRVKSNAAAGSAGTISVNTETSKCAHIGLPPGYVLTVTDVTGNIAAAVAPSASAVSTGYNSTRVSWNSLPEADGYEIWRATGADSGYTRVNTTSFSFFNDSGLTTGTVYYYKIRAFKGTTIFSGFSPPVSAKPVPATPSVAVASKNYNTIRITCQAVSGADGYEIWRAVGADSGYTWLAHSASPVCDNSQLISGTTYYYKVRAYKIMGSTYVYGNFSAVRSARPIPETPVVTLNPSNNNGILVSWGAISGASGYEVWRAVGADSGYSQLATTASASFNNTGLTIGTSYYYKVRAYRTVSGTRIYGVFSAATSGKTVPTQVTNASAVSLRYNSLMVSWGGVTGVTGYEIWSAVGADSGYTKLVTTTSTTYTGSGLVTGTAYYYKIRAYRTIGEETYYGAFSSTVSAVPTLEIVANAQAAASGFASINLSWSEVSGADGYQIWRAVGADSGYAPLTTSASAAYSDSGLSTGTTYYYKVRAYRTESASTFYGAFSLSRFATPALGGVTNANAAPTEYNSIGVSWDAVDGANGYEIWRAVGGDRGYAKLTDTATVTHGDTGLVTGTTYYYKVRAFRTIGETRVYGAFSPAVSAATPVLGAVNNANAAVSGFDSIDVSWDAVTDATGYQVWRAVGADSGYAMLTEVASASHSDTDLTTGTTYYYKVRAFRTIGATRVYGAFSPVKSATTQVLGSAKNTAAVSSGFDSIGVTWDAVTYATGYEVWRAVGADSGYTKRTDAASASYSDTGLTTGTRYYYKVRPYRTVGETRIYGAFAPAVSAVPVLASVANLAAVSSGFDSIGVSWDAVTDATGYEVWRAVGADSGYSKRTETASASYSDTGLTTGTRYYYKVRPYRTVGETRIYGAFVPAVSAIPAG
jgi:fibronectin type 3 domain-containing protein